MAMQPVKEDAMFMEMAFPVGGVDLSKEYELQAPQTTPAGVNVRGYEPSTMRKRGGSRPGLSQYVPSQVSGSNLIQHLNYIVDPQGAALQTAFDTTSPPYSTFTIAGPTYSPVSIGSVPLTLIPDPSSILGSDDLPRLPDGGRLVRDGGSGVQPNRNLPASAGPSPPPPPSTLAFVQSAILGGGSSDAGAASLSISLTKAVAKNDLLILAVNGAGGGGPGFANTITDTLSSTWNVLYFPSEIPGESFGQIYWALAGATGPCTVTAVGLFNQVGPFMGLLEYTGVNQTMPIDGLNWNAVTGPTAPMFTANTGVVPVSGSKEGLVAFFFFEPGGNPGTIFPATLGAPLVMRRQAQLYDTGGNSSQTFLFGDTIPVSAPVNPTATATLPFSPTFIFGCGYGISLKHT